MTLTKEFAMKIGAFNYANCPEGEHRQRYDYITFYEKMLGERLQERKFPFFKAFCPFHNDTKTPNLSINVISGKFWCFACGKEGGPWDFVVMEKKDGSLAVNMPNNISDPEDLKKIDRCEQSSAYKKDISKLTLIVEEKRAQQAHEWLFQQPFAMQHLQRDRGLTIDTIKKWRLGFLKGVITIPIPDITGKISSFKFHKKFQTEGAVNQLFPWNAVTKNKYSYVILVEGELDMIILNQNGFNAVTATLGANSWNKEFTRFFRRKNVYIAYDNDDPGKNNAKKIAHDFWNNNINTSIIQWPSFMEAKEDHIDFFVKYKKTAADYKELINNAVSVLNL